LIIIIIYYFLIIWYTNKRLAGTILNLRRNKQIGKENRPKI